MGIFFDQVLLSVCLVAFAGCGAGSAPSRAVPGAAGSAGGVEEVGGAATHLPTSPNGDGGTAGVPVVGSSGAGEGGVGGDASPRVLPVLKITTRGAAKVVNDVKVDGTISVIEDHDGTLLDLSSRPHTFDGLIGIEVRGNTSAGFPKKSYGLETRDSSGADLDSSLLGLPSESDWVLHGPYSDKTLLRNKLAYDLGRALGRYAPRSRFVELFVNDEYLGVYVFLEKIKRDTERVNIPKVSPSSTMGDVTGGYIFKLEAGSPVGGWVSAAGTAWQYHYPKFDQITVEQSDYLRDYIDAFESVMLGPEFSDGSKGYKAWIDVPSFVDFAIINELSRNVDGYRKSTYMYKQPNGEGGLLSMGPIWDFDLAFANADYCDGSRLDDFVFEGGNCAEIVEQIPRWWLALMENSAFTSALRCRWESLREGMLSDSALMTRIDAYREELAQAEPRDHEKWSNIGIYVWPNNYVGETYEDEVAYVKQWTVDRANWLDGNLPGTCY